jgi:hypothetical protein
LKHIARRPNSDKLRLTALFQRAEKDSSHLFFFRSLNKVALASNLGASLDEASGE